MYYVTHNSYNYFAHKNSKFLKINLQSKITRGNTWYN